MTCLQELEEQMREAGLNVSSAPEVPG